jgi:hypothetical protein
MKNILSYLVLTWDILFYRHGSVSRIRSFAQWRIFQIRQRHCSIWKLLWRSHLVFTFFPNSSRVWFLSPVRSLLTGSHREYFHGTLAFSCNFCNCCDCSILFSILFGTAVSGKWVRVTRFAAHDAVLALLPVALLYCSDEMSISLLTTFCTL